MSCYVIKEESCHLGTLIIAKPKAQSTILEDIIGVVRSLIYNKLSILSILTFKTNISDKS